MRTALAPPSPFRSAASATWLIAGHPACVELLCLEVFERPRRQCRVGLVGGEYGIARAVGVAFRFHDGLLAVEKAPRRQARVGRRNDRSIGGVGEGSNRSAAPKVSAASLQASTSASPDP